MRNQIRGVALPVAIVLLMVTGTMGAMALQATVVAAEGKVEIRRSAEGSWEAVTAGEVVPVGATISTSFNASAVLAIGESRVEVAALTRMRIDELASNNGVERSEIGLPVGRIEASVRGNDGGRAEFEVRSPIATASVRGTDFSFDGANLSVAEGLVILANRFSETVTVAQGESSSASGEGPPPDPVDAADDAARVTVSPGPEGELPELRSRTGGITINWAIQ